MKTKFNQTGIDWEAEGYFGCPDRLPSSEHLSGKEIDPWSLWLDAFHNAKLGNFAYIKALLPIHRDSEDWLLVTTCSDLIGNAGSEGCFSLLGDPGEVHDFSRAMEMCRVLYLRGRLSDIPSLVAVYEEFSSRRDADIIPVWISDLLESEDFPIPEPETFEEVEDYGASILQAYQRLADQLGTDHVYVFQGQKFGVITLAKYILEHVRRPYVRYILRQRFEASTGKNCTKFYKRGELRPLAAAAIVEEFLESPEAEKYEEGIRYFFGHRISD